VPPKASRRRWWSLRPEAAEVTPEVPARAQRLSRRPPRAQTRLVDSLRLSFTVVIGASVDVRTTHTARGFEVARAKMVAFGHPNHHTRQPVGDGGTAQCLWHSAVGTRGTAPLNGAVGSRGLRNRTQKGTVRASVAATALVWAPSIIALLILVIRAARDSVRSR